MSEIRLKAGLSRRTLLGGGIAAIASVEFIRSTTAQDKIPPEAVMYVDKTPNQEQFCANCLHWEGTPINEYAQLDESDPERATCALVTGDLAATGWCGVWASRG